MPEAQKSKAKESGATPQDFELGRQALLDITSADTIGEPTGSITEDEDGGVVTVYFATTMAGYPGWRWTVSIARVDGVEPSVLETELTPGDGALLSPDWVPWADRLADYKEAQAELAADHADADADDDDDDFDDDDINDDDEALLHSGDFDGVDIDSLNDDTIDGLASLAVGDDDADESEGESDDARPEPPLAPRRSQRARKQQQDDEGDQP